MAEIDSEPSPLGKPGLNRGVGMTGCRSRFYPDAEHTEWIEINLGDDDSSAMAVSAADTNFALCDAGMDTC